MSEQTQIVGEAYVKTIEEWEEAQEAKEAALHRDRPPLPAVTRKTDIERTAEGELRVVRQSSNEGFHDG